MGDRPVTAGSGRGRTVPARTAVVSVTAYSVRDVAQVVIRGQEGGQRP